MTARARAGGARGGGMSTDVYCSCGAQWHGTYALGNEIIALHAARGGTCRLVGHRTYLRLRQRRRCFCAACLAASRAVWRQKRQRPESSAAQLPDGPA